MAKKLTFFDQIKQEARKQGIKGTQKAARDFFKKKVREVTKGINRNEVLKSRPDRLRNNQNITMGRMYFFMYDPVHKGVLPYYDRFPLVIMLHRKTWKSGKKGFLGVNLHYLHPNTRGLFLSKLMEISGNSKLDEKSKLKATYGLLKTTATLKAFRPALKAYRTDHMRSRALLVAGDEWLPAAFLPVADFAKKSEQFVWAESKKIMSQSTLKDPRKVKRDERRRKLGK